MNSNIQIKNVVDNDMCIGCGVCASQCKSGSISMKMNQYGFYTASVDARIDSEEDCISVCPFNPNPDEKVKTEDDIANIFLTQAEKRLKKLGRYINTYAGYSVENRLTSSSGGIATYTLTQLLKRGDVQHIISVKSSDSGSGHYQYTISSSVDELISTAKTKYYPVTLTDAISKLKSLDGRVAIVGVACFIKAIRLAQVQDPVFNEKVAFLVGIICGGVKSAYFAEYLASKSGVSVTEYKKPEFRVKDLNSLAIDYSYSCIDANNECHTVKMRSVGDMWGTGMFKANACDYCDDVTTELADISLGDAWIEPYNQDGAGNSVVVTRSTLAEKIIRNGIDNGDLVLDELPEDRLLSSQQGSFNHRHQGLAYRIAKGNTPLSAIPPKRFDDVELPLLLKIIHALRLRTREKSLRVWNQCKSAESFDQKMKGHLLMLRLFTRLNHYQRVIIRKVRRA